MNPEPSLITELRGEPASIEEVQQKASEAAARWEIPGDPGVIDAILTDESLARAQERALHDEVFDSSMTDYEYFLKRKDQLTMDDQCKTADEAIEEQTRLGAWAANQAVRNGELEAKQRGLDQGILLLESLWDNLSKARNYPLAGYVKHVLNTLEGKAV